MYPRWSALAPPPTSSQSRCPPSVRILLFTDPSGRNGASSSRGTGHPRQRRLVFDSESVRRDEGVAAGDGKENYDEVVGEVGYKVG